MKNSLTLRLPVWLLLAAVAAGGCTKQDGPPLSEDDLREIRRNVLGQVPSMRFKVNADLEGKVTYLGLDAEADRITPGKAFKLTHYWKVTSPVEGWEIFVHCNDSANKEYLNFDHKAIGGRYPASRWKAGEIIRDEHSITLPPRWPDTKAVIYTGLWRGASRMKVKGPQDSQGRILAATLEVAPTLLATLRARYGTKLYSEYDEETFIRHLLKDRKGGFFVDIGSADYKKNSTTYYLEKHLGWKGIAVDANPSYKPGYANRPATRFFSYFISDKSDKETDFYVLPSDAPLGSGKKEHLLRFAHVQKVAKEIQHRKVLTITLDRLLEREKVTKVDFLSMDIEGAEPAALAGFDINRFKPDVVCIESDHAAREKILDYFKKAGYRRVEELIPFDTHNWYFVRP